MRDFSNFQSSKTTKGYDKYSMVGSRHLFDNVKIKNVKVPVLPEHQRNVSNYAIKRNNFLREDIQAREAIDFEKLQVQLISEAGIKVQLGDKTLKDLFQIQSPDPTDIDWLQEYQRRKDNGETDEQLKANPPLGRPQRTISKQVNIAQAGNNIETQLAILQSQVNQNKTETLTEIQNITKGIADLATISQNFTNLTGQQAQILQQVIDRLNIPTQYKQAGLPRRLYGNKEYLVDKNNIVTFLESNIPAGLSNQTPLRSSSTSSPISINTLENELQQGLILDVQTRTVITQEEAKKLANSEGVDFDVGSLATTILAPTKILVPQQQQAQSTVLRTDLGRNAETFPEPAHGTGTASDLRVRFEKKYTDSEYNFINASLKRINNNNKISGTFKRTFNAFILSLEEGEVREINKSQLADIINGLLNGFSVKGKTVGMANLEQNDSIEKMIEKLKKLIPTATQSGRGDDDFDLRFLRRPY